MKKFAILLLASVLLLGGCGGSNTPAAEQNVIKISNLADLPGAIQNDTIIELPEGVQNLSEAFGADYDGQTQWDHAYLEYYGDGFALAVTDVSNLTLRGAGIEKTELATEDPYSDVLRFENCSDVTVEQMTMGHLVEEGYCEGAVVEVRDCHGMLLQNLELYGCGTYGVENSMSDGITVKDSVIRNCSYGIVSCYDGEMQLENCQLHDSSGYTGIDAFESRLRFTGCDFRDNTFSSGFAPAEGGNGISFEKCTFSAAETFDIQYGLQESAEFTFAKNCKYDETFKLSGNVVYVHNPKELFEAIAPDTSIVLMGYWYDLSSWLEDTYYNRGEEWNAAHPYVELEEVYDGVMARIYDVDNLAIVGCFNSENAASITVTPRYADVFCFEECDGVTLANLTAGHTDTGDCVGNVVTLEDCSDVAIRNCDLYGCGVEGIYADGIENLTVTGTRVHDCSYTGLNLDDADGDILFENCDIYDNDCGIVYRSRTPMVLKNCRLGNLEMECAEENDSITCIDCRLFGDDDYVDYTSPVEGLENVRFDREVLKNTEWNELDGNAKLIFDGEGNATLQNYWDGSANLTFEYDDSGYYATGYETSDEYADAMLYLYAKPDADESDLTMELAYGEAVIYFK